MRELFNFIYRRIIDPLTLPVDPLYEWIFLFVIELIAFIFSFRIVQNMYDTGDISGSFLGRIFHWIIRILIFILIWVVVYWAVVITQCIIDNWVLALCVFTGIILVAFAIIVMFHYYKKNER